MKLKKTIALALAAMAISATAFANVAVKGYDITEDWVKMEVPQIKGAAGGSVADAKINKALNFNALMQLYSPLPQGRSGEDAMRTSFEYKFSGKDGVKEAREFLEDVGGFVNYSLHSSWYEAKTLGGSLVERYGLDGKYDVLYNGSKLLSVEQRGYLFTGGAHGNTLYKVSTFDLTTGNELQLADLFKPGSNYLERINKIVAKKVAAQPEKFFGPVEVKDGDQFYFDGKVLVITYAPYEVAPYAAGVVTFVIPAGQLSDIMADNVK